MVFDLIIRNGTVIDGTGSAGFCADVAIKGDSIVTVGEVAENAEAAREVDAAGKVVTPGFIDLHTHSDNSFLVDPLADSKLTQGVTFELMGNCGMSYCAPLNEQTIDEFKSRTDKFDPEYQPGWSTMDGYLSALEENGSTINIAAQVGHGTVRRTVMGMEPRMPTPEEIDQMQGIFADSLDEGALGMSTGLWYAPGSYSLADEVIALTQPAADRGKLYSSHIRSEADDLGGLFPAHAEAIEVGRRTGARIQISHVKSVGPKFWGRGHELIEGMEKPVLKASTLGATSIRTNGRRPVSRAQCSPAGHWSADDRRRSTALPTLTRAPASAPMSPTTSTGTTRLQVA